MGINREYGKYIPFCDTLYEQLEPCESYEDAVKAMNVEDWVRVIDFGRAEHYCIDCQEG